MKLSKISVLGVLALVFSSQVAPAQAAVTYPTEREYFPLCATPTSTNCYLNPEVKLPGDTEWVSPPSNVYFGINAFDIEFGPSLVIDMRLNNNQGEQDLSDVLPYGTEIKVEINTGSWQPNPKAHGVSVIRSFSQTQDSNQNWITSAHFSTINWSAASNCGVDDEDFANSCLNPGTASDSQGQGFWNDFDSFAQVVFWGVPLSVDAQSLAQYRMWDGMYISSNASGGYDPYFDRASSSWVITNVGPGRYRDATTTNWLYFQAFIPDRSIELLLDTPVEESLSSISFTRQDANAATASSPSGARIERVAGGILITMPRYTFDPNPGTPPSVYSVRNVAATSPANNVVRNVGAAVNATTLKITFKKKIAVVVAPAKASFKSASAKSKTITLVAKTASRATSYQATCSKGRTSKTVTSRTTTIKLTKMTKGTWTCKVRAKNSKTGPWSSTKTVKVR